MLMFFVVLLSRCAGLEDYRPVDIELLVLCGNAPDGPQWRNVRAEMRRPEVVIKIAGQSFHILVFCLRAHTQARPVVACGPR